jgi:hypothetical protein
MGDRIVKKQDHPQDLDHAVRDWTVREDAMRSAPSPLSSVQEQLAGLRQALDRLGRCLTEAMSATRADFVLVHGEPEQPCHCFCLHNHKGRDLCQGEAPASAIEVLRYQSAVTGDVDVAMCPPCAEATRAKKGVR